MCAGFVLLLYIIYCLTDLPARGKCISPSEYINVTYAFKFKQKEIEHSSNRLSNLNMLQVLQ